MGSVGDSGIPVVGNIGNFWHRVFTDPTGANYAQGQASANTTTNATNLQNEILQTPKQIAPDNFLAQKANALSNLRLGILSTMTGASLTGGMPSIPSMSGTGGGKTALGA